MKFAKQTFNQFTGDLMDILGENLFEIIIHGSYALGDFRVNLGDLDYLIVTNRNLDVSTTSRLFDLHDKYRSERCFLLHQLEGTFYPKQFLKYLEGQFTGCYIGTSRKGWKTIASLQNSNMDLRLINEHGIMLLGRNPKIYNPDEHEILNEQKSDLKEFRDTVMQSNDVAISLWISIIHWCARTHFYMADRKIGSKTDACRWCIQQPELEAFKNSFQEVECQRSPYKETKISEIARDTCLALLGFMEIVLYDTN